MIIFEWGGARPPDSPPRGEAPAERTGLRAHAGVPHACRGQAASTPRTLRLASLVAYRHRALVHCRQDAARSVPKDAIWRSSSLALGREQALFGCSKPLQLRTLASAAALRQEPFHGRPLEMNAGGLLVGVGHGEQGRLVIQPAGKRDRARAGAAVDVVEAAGEDRAGVTGQVRDHEVRARSRRRGRPAP